MIASEYLTHLCFLLFVLSLLLFLCFLFCLSLDGVCWLQHSCCWSVRFAFASPLPLCLSAAALVV